VRLVDEISTIVASIEPFDETERRHREACLDWLARTDDVFRRIRPATPSPHLVSYFLLRERRRDRVLLVDHRKADLWLPAGGHVEPGEHPVATVRRESIEELGVPAVFSGGMEDPSFITVTETVGPDRHTDVSLWFVLNGQTDQVFTPDHQEFRSVRWWTAAELDDADPTRFDPHLMRMLAKLRA
jgi:8-oxo-dGTP diphosphatase